MTSIVTSRLLKQLQQRPNLDIKANLVGLERTLDMMCEVSSRAPGPMLQCYQPLRFSFNARKVFNKAVKSHKRPEKMA